MTDLQKAINLIDTTDALFAAVSGETVYTSDKKGISALLDFISEGLDFTGMSAADSVVGKAAAILMLKLNLKTVHARLISEFAIDIFNAHGVNLTYSEKCDYIINRKGDGMCPMEETVLEINDIDSAVEALKCKMAQLRGGK